MGTTAPMGINRYRTDRSLPAGLVQRLHLRRADTPSGIAITRQGCRSQCCISAKECPSVRHSSIVQQRRLLL